MNGQRRKKMEQAFNKISEAMDILDEVKAEEYESLENLPDNFRNGDRGEEMQTYIEMIEETSNYLDDARSVLEQI